MFKKIYFDNRKKRIHLTETYNGQEVKSVEDFEYTFYVQDGEGKSKIKDVHGIPVVKQTCKDKRRFKQLKDTGLKLYESDINEEMQYLQNRYGDVTLKPDINDFNIAYLDIEVESEFEFPKPEECKYPINLITVYSSKTKKYYTWGNRPYTGKSDVVGEYYYFQDEKELLTDFIKWFSDQNFDILTGWYVKDFDVHYILNRKEKLDIEENLTKLNNYYHSLKWVITTDKMGRTMKTKRYYCRIAGLSILDSLELFQKFTFKTLEAYSLNFVANYLGLAGKIELEGQVNNEWKHNWNRFVEYNVVDVVVVKDIDDKKQHIKLAIQFASEALIPIDRVFSSIATVEGYILRDLHKKKLVLEDKKERGVDEWKKLKLYIENNGHKQNVKEGEQNEEDFDDFYVKGAHVEAKPGLYKNLISYDLTSLYPWNMIQFNVSPEVKVFNPSPERIAKGDLISTPLNGVYYLKNKKGIIPQIVEKIFNERSDFKKLKFKYLNEGDKELGNFYDSQQHIRKILINCFHKDTDIITVDGIKKIKDVKVGELVYSINKKTKKLEIKPVEKTYVYDYVGELSCVKNTNVDVKVTPEHTMLVEHKDSILDIKANDFISKNRNIIPIHNVQEHKTNKYIYLNEYINMDKYFYFIEYRDGISDIRLIRKEFKNNNINIILKPYGNRKNICICEQQLPSFSDIKKIEKLGYIVYIGSKRNKKCNFQPTKVKVDDLSKFMGYYISEGSVYTSVNKIFKNTERGISNKIMIYQYKHINLETYNKIADVMTSLCVSKSGNGTKVNKNQKGIYICSDVFYEIIYKYFGIKYNKHIFSKLYYKLNKKYIFDCLYEGDGNKNNKRYNISTKYKRFFNDYIKLILEMGYIPRYKIEKGEHDVYRICWNHTKFYTKKLDYKKELYNDKVYNLTVKDNYTVCVGLNGKFIWTGQSFYGCLANKHSHLYDVDNARVITKAGRTLIQFLSKTTDDYFKECWHMVAKKVFPNLKEYLKIKKDLVCVLDTDSLYLCLNEIKSKYAPDLPLMEFCHKMNDEVLEEFYEKILKIYADRYGAKQVQNFKREDIILKQLVLAKKKYIKLVLQSEDIIYDEPKLKATGGEIVKSDVPVLCRNWIKETVNVIFQGEHPDKDAVMKYLKKVKKEYKTQKMEDISFNKSVNEYTKYAKDTSYYVNHGNVIVKKGTPMHVRASMYYNFMIGKYNLPYMQIGNGMKFKYVYINPKNILGTDVIAFIGNWPKEFDKYFKINHKVQFEKSFLKAIQNIYYVMNWGEINFKAGGLNKFMKKKRKR